ncbi:MAG: AraC family ligand binding domain-containing protein [Mangrovibacterium sp.]
MAVRKLAFLHNSSDEKSIAQVNLAHRDDYYMFIFMERGHINFLLDFEMREISMGEICFTQPGQVHSAIISKFLLKP